MEDQVTGEAFVPPDYANIIWKNLAAQVYIRKLATVIQTTSNRVNVPILNRPQVAWGKLETAGQPLQDTYTNPYPSKTIQVYDLYGLIKIGEDLLNDAGYPLENMIVQGFADAMAQAQEMSYISTTSFNNSPVGILDGIGSYQTNGLGLPSLAANTVSVDDMFNIMYKLAPQYRMDPNSVAFIMHPTSEAQLRTSKDPVTGAYLWQPPVTAAMPSTFAGYPVYTSIYMPDPTTSSGEFPLVIFGNFKQGYMIVDRQDITVQRLNELYAAEGKIGIKVHMRTGANVVDPFAFTILYNNDQTNNGNNGQS